MWQSLSYSRVECPTFANQILGIQSHSPEASQQWHPSRRGFILLQGLNPGLRPRGFTARPLQLELLATVSASFLISHSVVVSLRGGFRTPSFKSSRFSPGIMSEVSTSLSALASSKNMPVCHADSDHSMEINTFLFLFSTWCLTIGIVAASCGELFAISSRGITRIFYEFGG